MTPIPTIERGIELGLWICEPMSDTPTTRFFVDATSDDLDVTDELETK